MTYILAVASDSRSASAARQTFASQSGVQAFKHTQNAPWGQGPGESVLGSSLSIPPSQGALRTVAPTGMVWLRPVFCCPAASLSIYWEGFYLGIRET